jgi:hypothetical protein
MSCVSIPACAPLHVLILHVLFLHGFLHMTAPALIVQVLHLHVLTSGADRACAVPAFADPAGADLPKHWQILHHAVLLIMHVLIHPTC